MNARGLAAIAASALLVGCALAVGSPVTAVNLARRGACAGGLDRDLRQTRAMDGVAARLAAGASLHAALGSLPLRPESATSIHLVGLSDDRAIARAIAGRYCRDLADPRLREIGVARRGRELWLVVIAPLDAPSPGSQREVAVEVLARVNAARAVAHRCGGRLLPAAPALRLSARLSQVALARSAEMARSGRLEHRGRDGSSPAERVRRGHYAAAIVGENIAGGVPTASEVVAGWLASPGHCANIMDARFTELGLGYTVGAASPLGIYWTQLFAKPATHRSSPAMR